MAIRNNPIQSYIGMVISDGLTIIGLYGRAKNGHPIFCTVCGSCGCRGITTFRDYKNKTAKCMSSLCIKRHVAEASDRRDSLSTQREWKQGLADERAEIERQEQQRLAEMAETQRQQAEARRVAALAEESGYNFYVRTKQRVKDTPVTFDLWLQQSDETRQRLLDLCTKVARQLAESEAPARNDKQFEEWQSQNPNGSLLDWILEKELRQQAAA
jgi:hypothetical protein